MTDPAGKNRRLTLSELGENIMLAEDESVLDHILNQEG
jgi:hypothetical protein